MIGLFLVNPEQKLAFAQFGQHVKIERFRYVRDARLCLVVHSQGVEELFTTEQTFEVARCLEYLPDVLVAHIDAEGRTIEEYAVPISR
jgi:hypothetical protein